MTTASRFRWTTVQRALDVLVKNNSNNQMVALMEELGEGPECDQIPANARSTPRLRNILSKSCRLDPPRYDEDGVLLSDRVVQEAARKIKDPPPRYAWEDEEEVFSSGEEQTFLARLAVDGWLVKGGILLPITPIPLEPVRSSLRQALDARGASEARTRLDQLESGLDDGHWESANGDARAFLNAIFGMIAGAQLEGDDRHLREGAARIALQAAGFFKPDPEKPTTSYEGAFVKALFALLGSDGAHVGLSDQATAIYRYAITVLTAEYFLNRSIA